MKIEQLLRCKTIIDEIQKGTYPSVEELGKSVNKMLHNLHQLSDMEHKDVVIRTIKRDIEDIRSVLKIDIVYNSKENGYFIENTFPDYDCDALLEAINLVFVLQNMENVKDYISFDARKAKKGTTYFFEILEAIRNKKKIEFDYTHYEKKELSKRLASPVGLKEFKGFWYLVTRDNNVVKTFGLDRVSNLTVKGQKSELNSNFFLDEYYKDCYGIVRFHDEEPQEILIWTTPIKASYYKANPLHKSQIIKEETSEYTIFSIKVYLTYDLQQELRSHGEDSVKITQPIDGMKTKRFY